MADASHFIAQTKPWAERYAFEFLTNRRPYSNAKFDVYWPRIVAKVRHARRERWVEQSFLSRLLFVRDDGRGTDELRSAPGVSHLLKFRVPQSAIDEMRGREVGGYVCLPEVTREPYRFKLGDRIRVPVPSLAGDVPLTALFQYKTSDTRAMVFVEMFRGMQRTEVDLDRIELV